MSDIFIDNLLKEAQARLEDVPKGIEKNSEICHFLLEQVKQDNLRSLLLKDAQEQVSRLTKTAMAREGMAYSPGAKDLRNSTCNVQWDFPDPSPRISQIKQDIEAMFRDYKKMLIGGRLRAAETGIKFEVPPDTKNPDEDAPEDASIYFRFQYKRHIMPVNCPEYLQRAQSVFDVLEQIFDGIDRFRDDIANNNIPLQDYFHNSVLKAEAGGGVKESDLQEFFLREKERYINGGPRLANGMPLRANFYSHVDKDTDIQITCPRKFDCVFPNEAVEEINVPGQLLRAIRNKVQGGFLNPEMTLTGSYTLNNETLREDIENQKRSAIERISAKNRQEKQQKIQSINFYWDKKYQDIVTAWKRGYVPQKVKDIQKAYETREEQALADLEAKYQGGRGSKKAERERAKHLFNTNYVAFVDENQELARPLIDVIFTKKTYYPHDLKIDDIRLILKHLTEVDPASVKAVEPQKKGRGRPKAYQAVYTPESFIVPDVMRVYRSNGLDSAPLSKATDPLGQIKMPVVPSIRTLPDKNNTVVYDRETGNLGRYQLAHNWVVPTGDMQQPASGGLRQVLTTWGEKCSRWLNAIQGNELLPMVQKTLRGKSQEEVMEAIRAAFGTNGLSSRTNAENILDLLNKYPDFESFKANHLRKSLPSEIRTVSQLQELLETDYQPDLTGSPELATFAEEVQTNPMAALQSVSRIIGDAKTQGWSQQLEAALAPLRQQFEQIKQQQADFLQSDPTKSPNFNQMDPATQMMLRKNRISQSSQLKVQEQNLTAQAQQTEQQFGKKILDLMILTKQNVEDWDTLTQCLSKCSEINGLNGKIRPSYQSDPNDPNSVKKLSNIQLSDGLETGLQTQDDFNLLKEYGYPVAKMMDFVNAIITTACKEESRDRADGRVEQQYAHDYSASSGIGGGGEVLLSVYYAFRPQWTDFSGMDPELAQKVKNELRSRRVRVGPTQPTGGQIAPMTQHPKEEDIAEMPTGEEQVGVMRVMKDVKYFIGLKGGSGSMLKSVVPDIVPEWQDDFERALELFKINYGDSVISLDAIIEPINVNLRAMDTALKNSFDKIREDIEREMNQPVAATWQGEDNVEEVIESGASEAEEVATAEEAGYEVEEAAPVEEQAEDVPLAEPEDVTDYDLPPEQPVPMQPGQPGQSVAQPQPVSNPQEGVIPAPALPQTGPEIKKQDKRPVLQNKKEPKRLENNRVDVASLEERLVKIANAFDKNGLPELADKVDRIIKHVL